MFKYFLPITFAGVAFAPGAFAQDNCETVDNDQYQGKLCDGKLEGPGKLFFKSGWLEADFKVGKPEGPGTMYFTDGSPMYEGSFKDGKKHGFGKWYDDAGGSYVGEFKSGLFDGEGTLTMPKGDYVYKGAWEKNKKHGQGTLTLTLSDGIPYKYSGGWKMGKEHGQGTEWRNGKKRYEGGWQDGFSHGIGKVYAVPDTDAELRERYGDDYKTRYNPNLTDIHVLEYEGEFKRGNRHGQGKILYTNGDIYEGRFDDGQPVEPNKHYDKDGQLVGRHLISKKAYVPGVPGGATRSGYCIVDFDIDAEGKPVNINVVKCTEDVFRKKSRKNVSKARFYPKMENGVAVPRLKWRKKVNFALFDEQGRYLPYKE